MLAAANMSGDETDGDKVTFPPVYRIVITEWQSLELRTCLWRMDSKYINYWCAPGPVKRRVSGNPIRVRVIREDSRTVPGVAPIGLWRNCYNPDWLAKLEDWEVELLEIVDEPYDFTFDEDTPTGAQTNQQGVPTPGESTLPLLAQEVAQAIAGPSGAGVPPQ